MLVLCVGASGRSGLAGCCGLVGGPERSCSRFNPLWRCDDDLYAFMVLDFRNKECGGFFHFKIKVYNFYLYGFITFGPGSCVNLG